MLIDIDKNLEDDRDLLGTRLIQGMKYRDITVKELAKHLRKTENAVCLWRGKTGNPSVYSIIAIARYLELNREFFFDKNMSIEDADLKLVKKNELKLDEITKELIQDKLFDKLVSKEQKELADIITDSDQDFLEVLLHMAKYMKKR